MTQQGRTSGYVSRAVANDLWLELLERNGKGWLPVLTSSMAPLIRPGDEVLVLQSTSEKVCFGDIFVFTRNGDLIVHRALGMRRFGEGTMLLEKGDTDMELSLVSVDSVVGRVTSVRRRGNVICLGSPMSRSLNLLVSMWILTTALAIGRLKSSRFPALRLPVSLLSQAITYVTNALVRMCLPLWYLCSLTSQEGNT
jgi:hypothetical protein